MKNTIGQFIAALRKANGMTQQEVADRLNVSNKTVSRWERDESAPDLSLIPVLAELFGVTCDELLQGERARQEEPRSERPMRAALNRAVSAFRARSTVALALSAVGFICMLGISYGFYRPYIGFAVLMLFTVAAVAVLAIAINQVRELKESPDLLEPEQVAELDRVLAKYSFVSLLVSAAGILLALPLVCFNYGLRNAVLSAEDYAGFWVVLLPIVICVYFRGRKPFERRITGASPAEPVPGAKEITRISWLQGGFCLAAVVLFWLSPYLQTKPYEGEGWVTAVQLLGLLMLCANVACFAVFYLRKKEYRRRYLFPGLRNLLLIGPAMMVSKAHTVGFQYFGEPSATTLFERYDVWEERPVWIGLAAVILLFSVFGVLDHFYNRRSSDSFG